MRSVRLFTDQPLVPDSVIDLIGNSANHFSKVLRARPKDMVILFNGDGNDYPGEVVAVNKHFVSIRLGNPEKRCFEPPVITELALGVSKGDRFPWAIQKATELGVNSIVLIYSERVDYRVPRDRVSNRLGHWQQIIISACEQCGRAKIPKIIEPQGLQMWVNNCEADLKYVLAFGASVRLDDNIQPSSLSLLVGPEGGLSEREINLAIQNGFRTLKLGPRTMRTETASLVALSILGARWGDLNP